MWSTPDRPNRPNLQSNRPDLQPNRPDLQPNRPDLQPKRLDGIAARPLLRRRHLKQQQSSVRQDVKFLILRIFSPFLLRIFHYRGTPQDYYYI